MARKKTCSNDGPSLENSASVELVVQLSELVVQLSELDLLKGKNSIASTLRTLKVIFEVFARNRIGLFEGTNARAQGLSEILRICEYILKWINPGTNNRALGFIL